MDYLLLFPTVAVGVRGTLSVRASQGLRRRKPVLLAMACYALATLGLARLVLSMPVGGVYAMWAGLGSLASLSIDCRNSLQLGCRPEAPITKKVAVGAAEDFPLRRGHLVSEGIW